MIGIKHPADQDLLQWGFTHGAIHRGRRYYKEGRVKQFMFLESGVIIARVSGSRRQSYMANVTLSHDIDGLSVEGECTCPMSYQCKHVVATLLQAANQQTDALLESFEKKCVHDPATWAAERWLDAIDAIKERHPEPIPTSPSRPKHLAYLLSPMPANNHYLQLTVQRFSILKTGHYSKPRPFSLDSLAQRRCLTKDDESIIAGLQFIRRGHASTWVLNEGKQARWLKEILLTERCFWLRLQGKPLALGAPKLLTFQWTVLPHGDQKLSTLMDGQPLPLFMMGECWYVDSAQGVCGPLETDVSMRMIEQMLKTPEIPPDLIPQVSKKIKQLAPQHTDLLPVKLAAAIAQEVDDPVPVIRLNQRKIKDTEIAPGHMQRSGRHSA